MKLKSQQWRLVRFLFSFYDVGGPNFGTDLSQGIGSFDPGKYIESYMNSPFANQVRPSQRKGDKKSDTPTHFPTVAPAETGRFGGTFGPKLKGFFKKLAEIHPATRSPMFAFNMIKGLKNSKDPKAFMGNMMKKLAMRKVMGNFGMSSMQRQGIGSLMNVAQGNQNWQQGLGGFATMQVFSANDANILKSPKPYPSQGVGVCHLRTQQWQLYKWLDKEPNEA